MQLFQIHWQAETWIRFEVCRPTPVPLSHTTTFLPWLSIFPQISSNQTLMNFLSAPSSTLPGLTSCTESNSAGPTQHSVQQIHYTQKSGQIWHFNPQCLVFSKVVTLLKMHFLFSYWSYVQSESSHADLYHVESNHPWVMSFWTETYAHFWDYILGQTCFPRFGLGRLLLAILMLQHNKIFWTTPCLFADTVWGKNIFILAWLCPSAPDKVL